MKKILLAMALCTGLATAKDIEILRFQDEMTDRVSFLPSKDILVKEGKKGFRIFLQINNELEAIGLILFHAGIGGCSENDNLIILLENGEKLKLDSWGDFNCKGNSYYNINSFDIDLLGSSPIKKIMFKNGRTYDSMTKEVPADQKNYFIKLFDLLSKKEYREVKE